MMYQRQMLWKQTKVINDIMHNQGRDIWCSKKLVRQWTIISHSILSSADRFSSKLQRRSV